MTQANTPTPKAQKRRLKKKVSEAEYLLLLRLRDRHPAQHPPMPPRSRGDKMADKIAEVMGSWRFIIVQSVLLTIWVAFNVVAFTQHWDPYPFILLNLMLSFQAAYAAPIIMMSQNRQSAIDRQEAKHDHEVNLKAELEIELLHDKMNLLKQAELMEIIRLLKTQSKKMRLLEEKLTHVEWVVSPSTHDAPLNDNNDHGVSLS